MDDDDDGLGAGFWLKLAGLFLLGAIGLFIIMWIFVRASYAWGFLGAFLFLAAGVLLFGWIWDKRQERRRAAGEL